MKNPVITISAKDRLNVRRRHLITVAAYIAKPILELERDLLHTKWFDYCFLDPIAATREFVRAYCDTYRSMWRKHGDISASKNLSVLPLKALFLASAPSSRERKFTTALWKARQHADALGVPYDFYCGIAFETALDLGYKRLPQPNQLYSGDLALRVEQRLADRWREHRIYSTIWSELPQFKQPIGHRCRVHARYEDWCVETLHLKHASPFNIADVVYCKRFISEERAINEFGLERVELARLEPRNVEQNATQPETSVYEIAPSCAFVPHAYRAGSEACSLCHWKSVCRREHPKVLESVVARFGAEEPIRELDKKSGRERAQKCRAHKKAKDLNRLRGH